MSCEACGGDGQIEVGAYRGDDSPDTRECRLCGGVVEGKWHRPVHYLHGGAEDAASKLKQLGQAAVKASAAIRPSPTLSPVLEQHRQIVREEVDKIVRRRRLEIKTPQDVAHEYAERLNADNERRQREAESHHHQWSSPQSFGLHVRFCCISCSDALVFSKHGNLSEGKAPNPFVLDELSRKAVTFAVLRDEELLRPSPKS